MNANFQQLNLLIRQCVTTFCTCTFFLFFGIYPAVNFAKFIQRSWKIYVGRYFFYGAMILFTTLILLQNWKRKKCPLINEKKMWSNAENSNYWHWEKLYFEKFSFHLVSRTSILWQDRLHLHSMNGHNNGPIICPIKAIFWCMELTKRKSVTKVEVTVEISTIIQHISVF